MFAFLYTLFIRLSYGLAQVAALFHPKTQKWVKGQQNIWKSLAKSDAFPQKDTSRSSLCIWFHSASLGEFEQGRPVIEACRKLYPNAKIVLTFFSPSGYEHRQNYDQVDIITYLPLDTPTNVSRFLDIVRPDIALFIKYEFWYHYLSELKKRQVPALLFSAIFRPNQLFFKSYGGFYRKLLFCLDTILVQNQASAQLLQQIHYPNVIIAGDTRLDRVVQIASQARNYPLIKAFKGDSPLMIVGSAWPDDLDVIIPFINQFRKPLKVVVAPHEIDAEQIKKYQQQLQVPTATYLEQLPQGHISPETCVLFLDTVGMLSAMYRYADFVFVGGAFKDGLHNTMEPAVFGMPIFFGQPYFKKFQEALDLLRLGGAITVKNTQEFEKTFTELYDDLTLRRKKGEICRTYVHQNSGATEKVMQQISQILNKKILG
ncbi:3-deoxy-D-manno-octulosonic acid transferase [Runella zeae]|uniref:3-deoxy-D-manno-octulosonic acid transferase n=1 Tax=Runella zeae TaxID=94255 RepID=UPI002357F33D|nr:glycosyltransferase N-terminal domain-containing protein [Runella zeae]